MHTCSACGTENRAGRRFCAQCGAALSVNCSNCGGVNQPTDRFCGDCGAALDAVAVSTAPDGGRIQTAASGAERRLVSVLFADLVGFTTLSEHRDPEEVRELLSSYFERCRSLIERYGGIIDEAFARIDGQAASMTIEALADALVYFLVEIQGESKAMRALLEARAEWSAKRHDFRNAALGLIARTLRLRSPQLRPETARDMAVVLLHTMKTMKALAAEDGGAGSRGASAELRDMARLYLASKLPDGA